jgi:hypothetical protein
MQTHFLPQRGYQPSNALTVVVNNEESTAKPFIEANTVPGSLCQIRQEHLIPVYANNDPLISQLDFIEVMQEKICQVFPNEKVLLPSIRLSHPIMGRTPEARNKKASELESWEKTLYYERMAFIIELPSITDTIGGERLSLTIGGVKAYNLDNLGAKKGSEQRFQIFIGFKTSVCTNLSVMADCGMADLRVRNLEQLQVAIHQLIGSFDAVRQLQLMQQLTYYSLTEQQFAQLIGRCKMYQHLPVDQKSRIPELQFGDSQINSVCRDYYRDHSFCKEANGQINLWKLHSLFTLANKTSYIDNFVDRAVNASTFTYQLADALERGGDSWFLG